MRKVSLLAYDVLNVMLPGLVISPEVVSSVVRIARQVIPPDQIQTVADPKYVPRQWLNAVVLSNESDENYTVVTGKLMHSVHWFIANVSGIEHSFWTFGFDQDFEQWFTKQASIGQFNVEFDELWALNNPEVLTEAYYDIMLRFTTSMYIFDSFGTMWRQQIQQEQYRRLGAMMPNPSVPEDYPEQLGGRQVIKPN